MADDPYDDTRDLKNMKGWVKVEEYHPEKLRVFTPKKTIRIRPNDKAILEIQKVTFANGAPISEEKEEMRVWCCDDEPDIKALSEGIKGRRLGEFLRIRCPANWAYHEQKRQQMGISDDQVIIFWVWIKEVDPYLQHDPKCCTVL
eukprot:407462_1